MSKTTKPLVKIHNTETGEIIEREMTDFEFEQYQIDQAYEITRWAEINAK